MNEQNNNAKMTAIQKLTFLYETNGKVSQRITSMPIARTDKGITVYRYKLTGEGPQNNDNIRTYNMDKIHGSIEIYNGQVLEVK